MFTTIACFLLVVAAPPTSRAASVSSACTCNGRRSRVALEAAEEKERVVILAGPAGGNERWAAGLRATNALAAALLTSKLGVPVAISVSTTEIAGGDLGRPSTVDWTALAGGAGLHAHLEVWPHDPQHASGWATAVVERLAIDDAGPTGPHAPVTVRSAPISPKSDRQAEKLGAFDWGRGAAPASPRALPPGFLGGPSKAVWIGLPRYSPRAACFLKRFWLRTRDQQDIVDAATPANAGSDEGGYCTAACLFMAAHPARWARFVDGCSATAGALPAKGAGGCGDGIQGNICGLWAAVSRILLALGSVLGTISFCTTNKIAERKCKQVGGYLLVFAWFYYRRVRKWWWGEDCNSPHNASHNSNNTGARRNRTM